MTIKSPRNETTVDLLSEENRLYSMLVRLKKYSFMKGNRAQARRSLDNIQRELNQRGLAR